MTWALGIAKGALSALSGLLSAAIKWAAIGFAFLAGKRSAEAKANRKALETKEKQLEIAARAPLHRSDILERLHKRKRT